MIDEKTRRFAANSIFPSLVLAVFGFALTQAGAAQLRGSWLLHGIIGIPGLTLSGLVLYRARLHWSTGVMATPGQNGDRRPSFNGRDVASCLSLLGTGILVASSAGSILSLGIVALLIYLVPWAKIPVCRTRFIASTIITLAGAIGWLALLGEPARPLHYVAAAWMLLILSMMMMCLVLVSLPYGYRMHESAEVDNPTSAMG